MRQAMRQVLQAIILITMAIAGLSTITGCAVSVGHEFDSSQVGEIKRGVSTKADVRRLMGKPHSVTVDGKTETWEYSHWRGGNLGQTFASMYGGSDVVGEGEDMTVIFKGDVVRDYTFTKTQ